MKNLRKFIILTLVITIFGLVSCEKEDEVGGTITISYGISGSLLEEVYIVEKGESWSQNLIQGETIGYNSSGKSFNVAEDGLYSVKCVNNSLGGISGTCDVFVEKGDNKLINISYGGGPYVWWLDLTVLN